MKILSIEIKDILSIQSASIQFEDNGLVLIEGWNHDTQRANGAGKSAIFNSLSFALYDKLPRKITASEILRRGTKSGYVKVDVACGPDIWTVLRYRPKNVKFYKNGIEENITQSEFESNIKLTYDQFLLTVYTPQANSGQLDRFINVSDSDKKAFLLQLLNLDKFSECKKTVDEQVKDLVNKADKLKNSIALSQSKIDTYKESLVDSKEIEGNLISIDQQLRSLNDLLIQQSQTPKPDLSKYSKIEDDLRNKLSEISQNKMKRQMLHDKYTELLNSISNFNPNQKCSECGHLLNSEDSKTNHEKHQDKVKLKMTDIKKQIDDLDASLYKESSLNDLVRKLREKKNKESEDYNASINQISEIKTLIKTNKMKQEMFLSKLDSNNNTLSKIESLETEILKISGVLTTIESDIEIYKTLSMIYSPTGAQAYVLDSVVDSFNEIVQKYVDLLSPNITYVLNSYKETSKGDVVAKFSETLMFNGEQVSVGSLSGGEQKGLSLCIDFTILEVLETQFGMKLNPIILDEPFDGLDVSGREIVLDLLEQLASNRQILVIDHSSEAKSSFSKVISVSLKDKISSIS